LRLLRGLRHLRPRPRLAVIGAHGVRDFARLGAVRFLDGVDHNARRGQRTRFLGQTATERLHEGVVDLLTGHLCEQGAHLEDVVLVAAALVSALLEHRGARRRPAGASQRRTTRSRGAHAWPRRQSRTHWPRWSRPAGTHRSADWRGATWRKLGLELGWPTSASPARAASRRPATVTTELIALMIAARQAAPVTIEAVVEFF